MGESGSEVSYFIPEPRKFVEVTRLSYDIKKPWLKANLTKINNLIKDQNFLVQDPKKGEPVTTCMDFYKGKMCFDRSIDKLKLRIVVRGDMQNE